MTHYAIIIGHGKMAHVAEFLLPMWREVFDSVHTVSPRNDRLDLYGCWSFKIGQSSHSGTDTADRFMAAGMRLESVPAPVHYSANHIDAEKAGYRVVRVTISPTH